MNRLTSLAMCLTLVAAPALSTQALPAAIPQAQPGHMQRPALEAIHLAQNVTRQEFECVLSGVCGVVESSRING